MNFASLQGAIPDKLQSLRSRIGISDSPGGAQSQPTLADQQQNNSAPMMPMPNMAQANPLGLSNTALGINQQLLNPWSYMGGR